MSRDERSPLPRRIPVARLLPRPLQTRADPAPGEVDRLAASIRKHGLLHPILVRPAGRSFEVVCGQRRLLACRALGWGEVPAYVQDLSDRHAFELSVAENAWRGAVSMEERRQALRRLAELFPGRRWEDLESWLGPDAGAPAPAPKVIDPLPDWLDQLPETQTRESVRILVEEDEKPAPAAAAPPGETAVVVARDTVRVPAVFHRSLLARVKQLLASLSRSGKLNLPLLEEILAELFRRFESLPLHDFLDLVYRGRSKRYVSRHCLNVAKLSLFLAKAMGMSRPEVEELVTCGLLHDVGMMRIKQEIFTKHAALDPEEWEQVKGHPVEGSLLMTKEVVLRDVVARVAQEHHERPDGSGYPQGKKKEEIHFYARLINVVDTYGAMVSPRAHRLPLLPHLAMKIVMDQGAKGMLDWDIVMAFVKAISVYPVGSYLKLEGGEIARVVRASPDIPEKPVIAVIADATGALLRHPVELDLAMTEPLPKFAAIPAPL